MLMSVRENDSESSRSTNEGEATISVLVVDDHPVVRMGVSMVLAAESSAEGRRRGRRAAQRPGACCSSCDPMSYWRT